MRWPDALIAVMATDSRHVTAAPGATIRPYPYPFKAILAICSDLDETPDRHSYWSLMQFLNSRMSGPLGAGVGLEVGNSIYFDMPPGQFSYWGTDECGRAMIQALIRSGHIDCLHSFGDLATSRTHAGRALEELARHDCRIAVWVDHAIAPSNFGSDIMNGFGDVLGHPAYHADLTISYGVRYIWRGRVTSVIGQDRPSSLQGVWSGRRPLASVRTVAKEFAKQVHSRHLKSRYRLHRRNRVLASCQLRDGGTALEFLRSNPHWGGVSSCDTADGIPDVLTASVLDRLVERRASCVLYTHLGKRARGPRGNVLSASAVDCFRLLAERQSRGDVLVTTTKRLLDYCWYRDGMGLSVTRDTSVTRFDLSLPVDTPLAEVQGLTLYVDPATKAEVRLNGRRVTNVVANPPDETGRFSVSIPWTRLDFPTL